MHGRMPSRPTWRRHRRRTSRMRTWPLQSSWWRDQGGVRILGTCRRTTAHTDRKPRRAGVRRVREVQLSPHSLLPFQAGLHCNKCGQFSPSAATARWLSRPCFPMAGLLVHPSHRAHLAVYKGVVICLRCGGWGVTARRKLNKECRPPTLTGKRAISSICRGRRPQGLPSWPDGTRAHFRTQASRSAGLREL